MSSRKAVLIIAVTSWFVVIPVVANEQRIAVDVDTIGTGGSDSITEVFEDVLGFYLAISSLHSPIRFDTTIAEGGTSSVEERIDRYDLDLYLIITLQADSPGAVDLAAELFAADSPQIPVSFSKQYKLSDELYNLAHGAVSDILIDLVDPNGAWGSLVLENRGSPGSFDLYVDGLYVGRNVTDKMLLPVGRRIVLAQQERPFGTHILVEEFVDISQTRSEKIIISIPDLTDLERSAFERLEQTARDRWQEQPSAAAERLRSAVDLLRTTSASDALEGYFARFKILARDLERGTTPSITPVESSAGELISAELLKKADDIELAPVEITKLVDTSVDSTESVDEALPAADVESVAREAGLPDVVIVSAMASATAESETLAIAQLDEPIVSDTTPDTAESTASQAPETESEPGEIAADETADEKAEESKATESVSSVAESDGRDHAGNEKREIVYEIKQKGLFGPLLFATTRSLLSAGALVTYDIGISFQLSTAARWDTSVSIWGAQFDSATSLLDRVIVDFGSDYMIYAYSAASSQAAGLLTGTFIYPYRRFELSRGGKLLYLSGLLLELSGSVLGALSRDFAMDATQTERQITESTVSSAELNAQYRAQYSAALMSRFGSYTAFGVGTIISLTAASASGRSGRVIANAGQGFLFIFGSLFSSAANMATYLATVFRTESEYFFDVYSAPLDPGDPAPDAAEVTAAYDAYTESYNYYTITTIASYGLWGAAGLFWLTAVALPDRRSRDAVFDARVYVRPVSAGSVQLGIRFSL